MADFLRGGIMVLADWVLEIQPPDPHPFKWVLVVGHRLALVILILQPFVVMEVFSLGELIPLVN
jgi:hypothetical protein